MRDDADLGEPLTSDTEMCAGANRLRRVMPQLFATCRVRTVERFLRTQFDVSLCIRGDVLYEDLDVPCYTAFAMALYISRHQQLKQMRLSPLDE